MEYSGIECDWYPYQNCYICFSNWTWFRSDSWIYLDKFYNSTTNLDNYAHFVAFADYENRPSDFHAFKLLELSTNSSILAGKPAYRIIGTYQKPPFGLQKLIEVGTIIGGKAYSVQYIAYACQYSNYLLLVQKMIRSLVIKNQHKHILGTKMHPNNTLRCCFFTNLQVHRFHRLECFI
jgi:hypothetical protein